MKIDKNSYSLSDKHFHSEKYKKRKIVLSNSLCGDMKFFRGWELRRNGTYKKVTHFSVDTNGKVYEHYSPNTNKYKDWIGNIYKGIDVFKKEWRGHFFWASYNKEQMDSVGELVDFLCDRYKIERNSLSHNVMFTDAPSFNGVLSRSNFSRKYKDVSPSFDFGTIDNKLLKENIDD